MAAPDSASNPERDLEREQAVGRYNILHTPPEQEYDDIAKLASIIFETPVALITFIDNGRFWFKASIGVDISEAPCNVTPCQSLMENPSEVLVVPDIATDERVAAPRAALLKDNRRFYAGAALVTPDGQTIGTICVFDSKPRNISPEKAQTLAVLARHVMAVLELRHHAALSRDGNVDLAPSMTDPLTGLPNGRAFDRNLMAEGGRAQRTEQDLSVMLIELDAWPQYRAEFGTKAADNVLYAAAQVLANNARPYDYLARYDDEKFAMILPGTNKNAARVIADRLKQAVADIELPHRSLNINIGISFITRETDASSLLLAATMALHIDQSLDAD